MSFLPLKFPATRLNILCSKTFPNILDQEIFNCKLVLESEFQPFLHVSINVSRLFFIYFIPIACVASTISLMRSFVALSSLDLSAALHRKSISGASNVRFAVSLIGHISQLYMIIVFIAVLYLSILLLLLVSMPKYSV